MIHGGDGQVWTTDRSAGQAQAVERLRRGHFVHQVEVDVEQVRLAFDSPDHVPFPDFVGQGLGLIHVILTF